MMLRIIVSYGIVVVEGFTALLAAAYQCHPPVVDRLIEAGADVNAIDSQGRNALHLVFEDTNIYDERRISGERRLNTIEALLKLRETGDVINVNLEDNRGLTPLMLAVARFFIHKSLPIIQLLIDAGADVNAVTQEGETFIDLAHEGSRYLNNNNAPWDIINLLLNGGLEIKRNIESLQKYNAATLKKLLPSSAFARRKHAVASWAAMQQKIYETTEGEEVAEPTAVGGAGAASGAGGSGNGSYHAANKGGGRTRRHKLHRRRKTTRRH